MPSRAEVVAWCEDAAHCEAEGLPDGHVLALVPDVADMLERAASILDDYDRYWDEDDLPQRTRAWMDEWRGDSPSETDESGGSSPSGAGQPARCPRCHGVGYLAWYHPDGRYGGEQGCDCAADDG